jgi:hypothetical protein
MHAQIDQHLPFVFAQLNADALTPSFGTHDRLGEAGHGTASCAGEQAFDNRVGEKHPVADFDRRDFPALDVAEGRRPADPQNFRRFLNRDRPALGKIICLPLGLGFLAFLA